MQANIGNWKQNGGSPQTVRYESQLLSALAGHPSLRNQSHRKVTHDGFLLLGITPVSVRATLDRLACDLWHAQNRFIHKSLAHSVVITALGSNFCTRGVSSNLKAEHRVFLS